ncbi:MAG: triose-phosphate isomerase [Chloroflexi bacterium]|nr:triose-phosphate isomerase [Chloroflexota bacterium]
MARKPIIAGNWKMNKAPDEAVAFLRELAPMISAYSNVERVVAPSFLVLTAVAAELAESPIAVAAQDAHWAENGAYTSQVSVNMLSPFIDYIIIGHSECRAYLNETDANVNRKAQAILAAGRKPIIAVGESLAQNEAGETVDFVRAQVSAALEGIRHEQMTDVVIAYEPIWAIGTGKSASGELADEIIRTAVRATVGDFYGGSIADAIRIQYGGSVKPSNMEEFMAQANIDGALVGGASLDADDFAALVEIAARVKGP